MCVRKLQYANNRHFYAHRPGHTRLRLLEWLADPPRCRLPPSVKLPKELADARPGLEIVIDKA